ncbi:MAG: hypothetical protein K5979_07410 [Ruminococcus sp.]|nr:hypothetical protein [Ruminococcus sp.]
MEDNFDTEQEKRKKPLKTVSAVLLTAAVLVIGGLLLLVYSSNMTWGGYTVDSRNALASTCGKAVNAQVIDYYKAQDREVPADKEYLVRATYSMDGLVNETCELLPESEKNKYADTSKATYYIVVKFRDGAPAEAWSREGKPIADDMLRSYDRQEQQEMFGNFKGARDVIGYVNYKDGVQTYH